MEKIVMPTRKQETFSVLISSGEIYEMKKYVDRNPLLLDIAQLHPSGSAIASRMKTQLLSQLVARRALADVLEMQEAASGKRLDLALNGGWASEEWRKALLGIVDLMVGSTLVAAWVGYEAEKFVWLNRVQVESRAAPDTWVVMTLLNTVGGVEARMVGWLRNSQVLRKAGVNDGIYNVPLANLSPPSTFFEYLVNSTLRARSSIATSTPGLDAPLSAYAAPTNVELDPQFIVPSSRMAPDQFNLLLASKQLSMRYLQALATSPPEKVRVPAKAVGAKSAGDKYAVPRGTVAAYSTHAAADVPSRPEDENDPTAASIDDLLTRVRQLIRARDQRGALSLLKSVVNPSPDLLLLRSALLSLQGNFREALRWASEAFKLRPTNALSPQAVTVDSGFGFAWQYVPASTVSSNAVVEVIDVDDPDAEVGYSGGEPHLLRAIASGQDSEQMGQDAILLMDMVLPRRYAGYAYRLLIVPSQVRMLLHLDSRDAFRRAFSSLRNDSSDAPSADEAAVTTHLLVSQGGVVARNGQLVGGRVNDLGMLRVSETVPLIDVYEWSSTDPSRLLVNKTVVVVLFRDPATSNPEGPNQDGSR